MTAPTRLRTRWHGDGGGDDEPFEDVRDALRSGQPLALLQLASSLVSVVDPRSVHPLERRTAASDLPPLDALVSAFAEIERAETTALLWCIGALAPDEEAGDRARRAAAERRHVLPKWLSGLEGATPGPVAEMGHVFGDGDDILIQVDLTEAPPLTLVTYIDRNAGGALTDGFAVPDTLAGVRSQMLEVVGAGEGEVADVEWREVDPAGARARLTEAVHLGAITIPPYESETWPACRPLVEWAARLLPEGGTGHVHPKQEETATAALADRFFSSAHAEDLDPLDRPDHRELMESLLWFGTDYGPGDPLRWSPASVEILLLDWFPRKVVAPAKFLVKLVPLLRSFVAFAGEARGLRPGLVAATQAAVDQHAAEYRSTVRAPRPQGPMALLAAMDAAGAMPSGPDAMPSGPDADDLDFDDVEPDYRHEDLARFHDGPYPYGWGGGRRAEVLAAVGGEEALAVLDDVALPDEPFAWEGIPDDARSTVGEILERCDRFCDELLDHEYRTACRRYLALAARTAPQAVLRGRSDITAAAVACTIGRANELFHPGVGTMRLKELHAWFGLSGGSASQRAQSIVHALHLVQPTSSPSYTGINLGQPGLLVSTRRRALIDERQQTEPDPDRPERNLRVPWTEPF